ncbi:MAG: hypothetical protein ACI4F1_03140 [Bariatricus sp.]
MACFLVPAAEAVVTTVAAKVMESKEKESREKEIVIRKADQGEIPCEEKPAELPFYKKLQWLNKLLWGGSALLAFEHVWHGEVTPWFPFLTAAGNPEDAAVMLQEMSTVGVTMAVFVTAAWLGMLAVTGSIEKRAKNEAARAVTE